VAHADVFVGRLHQLPAWRMARAGDMRGLEFLARAHVEQISAAFLILEPCLDAAGVREFHAKALRDALGGGLRLGEPGR